MIVTQLPDPPRPDLDGLRTTTRRSILGPLLVLAAWYLSERTALLNEAFPPNTIRLVLMVGWLPFVVAAFAVRRAPSTVRGRITTGIAAAAFVVPLVIMALVPELTTTPLPGQPSLAVSASPTGNADLFLIRDGGRTIIPLTASRASEFTPDLSPDGRSIVYVSDESGSRDLYVMELDSDGRPFEPTRITSDDTWETDPHWSPDGRRILFAVIAPAGSDIAVMHADGSHRTFLTRDHQSYNPSWSPDGTRIAYRRTALTPPADEDIWVMDADGSHAHDLLELPGPQWGPAWSPDGRFLTFTSMPDGDPDVQLVRADGTGLTNLTSGSGDRDEALAWTPDGHVMFLSDRSHTGGTFLYFMDPDGSNVYLSVVL
jgi:TolB protein